MPQKMTVHGVPRSLATDGGWFASEADTLVQPPPPPEGTGLAGDRLSGGIGAVVLLVLLGDFLFWGYWPGVSLSLFAVAVFGAAWALSGLGRAAVRPAVLMGLAVVPVVEHVQPLSIMILLVGGIAALAWLKVIAKGGVAWIAAAAIALVKHLPRSGVRAAMLMMPRLWSNVRPRARFDGRGIWRNWAFPLGGALVLGALLTSANPVLAQILSRLFRLDVDVFELIARGMLWSGLALLVWPLLNAPEPERKLDVSLPSFGHRLGLNCGSVLRALVVFNLFLGVQSVLDFSILLGGADLPRGMSYATYAHRGAYPLLVTAMLAGVFTFAARPFLKDNVLIQPLLLLWVVQNVALTAAAALRLELYIAEYGLTYLRIYALIWMALVAVGLVTVLWHVLRARSQGVLLARLAGLGFGTLYLCAFVNFAGIIAADSLARAADPDNTRRVDWNYLCQLGPTAAGAIADALEAHPDLTLPPMLNSCRTGNTRLGNWRELDFRTIRTHDTLVEWSY